MADTSSRVSDPAAEALRLLRDPHTIRARAHQVLDRALRGDSAHFVVEVARLHTVANRVAELTRKRYPTLAVPLHSRWRHFVIAGENRWSALASRLPRTDPLARARAAIDLVVVSVLLDAGAGANWRFDDRQSGQTLERSEGLAAASIEAFADGAFSSNRHDPLRADADGLTDVDASRLAALFQVDASNPLPGLEGRAALLRALGRALRARPDLFGDGIPRPGHLLDLVLARGAAVPAADLLALVLDGFSDIWPGRHVLEGRNLGDTWPLAGVGVPGLTQDLMPFHKLSQWLTYSLVEPLADAGVEVSGLDALTGLAEYRNGGLFVDGGVLQLREPARVARPLAPEQPLIVEWRALTIGLLERLAPMVRRALGARAASLPLGAILEGGTWAAGRALAYERRADGAPPIQIRSDGTVF